MKKTTTFLVMLLAIVGITSCAQAQDNSIEGNGTIKTQTRAVQDFTSLKISGGFEVILTQGANESLKLEADENLLPLIETQVQDGVLRISTKKSTNIKKSKRMKVYVTVQHLKSLDLSGGILFTSTNTLKAPALKLDASGGIKLTLALEVDQLDADMSGGCDIALSGSADKVKFDVSGAVNLKATDLKAQYFTLDASGASNAEVFASKELNVDASGIVSVGYKGSPKVHHTGMGKVKPL